MENINALTLLFIAVIAIGLFFLLRSIMLWYWKIDDIVSNQNHQNKLIYEQNQLLRQALGISPGIDNSMSKEEIDKKAKLYDQAQK